jgi:hypothetical protein
VIQRVPNKSLERTGLNFASTRAHPAPAAQRWRSAGRMTTISKLLVAVLVLAPFRSTAEQPTPVSLIVDAEDQNCESNEDCEIVGTSCSSCECGAPVNRSFRREYEIRLAELCRDYSGPVCRCKCPTPFALCEKQTCVLSAVEVPNKAVPADAAKGPPPRG